MWCKFPAARAEIDTGSFASGVSIRVSFVIGSQVLPGRSHFCKRHGAHMSSCLATFGTACGASHTVRRSTSCAQGVHGRAAHTHSM